MITPQILSPTLLGSVQDAPAPASIRLGDVGKCPDRPTLVIGIVDDSGSVTAPGGVDPISNRYAELALAIHAVAQRCRCKQELAAIVHFDSPAGDTEAVPLTREGLTELEGGLAVPPGARGISDMLPAITKASELAAAHPDHQAVVVVFSDFRLTDKRPDAPFEALANFPGRVYGCVLGGRDDPLPGIDDQLAVHTASPPGAIARALLSALTHHREDSRTKAEGSRRRRFHNAVNAVRQLTCPGLPTSEVGGRLDRQAARLSRRRGHGKKPPNAAQ